MEDKKVNLRCSSEQSSNDKSFSNDNTVYQLRTTSAPANLTATAQPADNVKIETMINDPPDFEASNYKILSLNVTQNLRCASNVL